MMLLNRPMKKRAPGYVPIIAVLGVVSAGMFFTYTMTRMPMNGAVNAVKVASLNSAHQTDGGTMLSGLAVPQVQFRAVDFQLSSAQLPAAAEQTAGIDQNEFVRAKMALESPTQETINLDN
ncbi:hypothetical protein [Asticcacaulis sp. MM231]|uniref:hypothetical protein n=1 Tax=Asticcacaulis sp. MM231 TaxID=3157666 RepID=UPI0032D57D60